MKINEVVQSKVTSVSGGKINVDHGDGTSTVVDTNKNPDAIERDEQGKLKINTQPKNSAMAKKDKQASAPRPGEKIEVE